MPDSEIREFEVLGAGEREMGRGYLYNDRRFITQLARTRMIPFLPNTPNAGVGEHTIILSIGDQDVVIQDKWHESRMNNQIRVSS
ncbi:hypothetical protein PG996_016092 [Apiospora saccharicola]|uniref:Uncharacterized protein n=1 Tax=Apiospora saccharicola TaxID=335842 RepID=A0ABR1TMX8_9PEZI